MSETTEAVLGVAYTDEELIGGRAAWDLHRKALGGVSSVSGAPLPDWSGCNEKAKAAHVEIFRGLKRVFQQAGIDAFRPVREGERVPGTLNPDGT